MRGGSRPFGQTLGVLLRLDLDARQGVALGLRLEDADGLAVDEEQVVGEAVAVGELELADGDAAAGGQVHLVAVLDDPAGLLQLAVDGRRGPAARDQAGLGALRAGSLAQRGG